MRSFNDANRNTFTHDTGHFAMHPGIMSAGTDIITMGFTAGLSNMSV